MRAKRYPIRWLRCVAPLVRGFALSAGFRGGTLVGHRPGPETQLAVTTEQEEAHDRAEKGGYALGLCVPSMATGGDGCRARSESRKAREKSPKLDAAPTCSASIVPDAFSRRGAAKFPLSSSLSLALLVPCPSKQTHHSSFDQAGLAGLGKAPADRRCLPKVGERPARERCVLILHRRGGWPPKRKSSQQFKPPISPANDWAGGVVSKPSCPWVVENGGLPRRAPTRRRCK